LRCTWLLFAALLLSPSVPAQSQSPATSTDGCSVEILEVSPQYHQYGPGAIRTYLAIRYRNISGKDIRAVKFGALFFNVLDEPTASYSRYVDPDAHNGYKVPRPGETAKRRTAAAAIPLLPRWHQQRSAFVFNEEHDKFRWFSIARVPANDMNIVGTFIEALTRR